MVQLPDYFNCQPVLPTSLFNVQIGFEEEDQMNTTTFYISIDLTNSLSHYDEFKTHRERIKERHGSFVFE